MDAALHTTRRIDSPLHAVPAAADAARLLTVGAEYRLSETGRKVALLNGGDGRADQQMTLTLPATRLHLVRVSKDGGARLKLRPQATRKYSNVNPRLTSSRRNASVSSALVVPGP